MGINETSLILVKGDQLPDATTVASLAISLSGAGVTKMHKMRVSKVKIMATKAIAIKAVIFAMVRVMCKPWLDLFYNCL